MVNDMGIQYDILASTLRILRDREVDNTFRTIPLLEAVERAGNVEMINGGQKVDHPVILAEHSNITQLTTGYESVNLAVKDALVEAGLSPIHAELTQIASTLAPLDADTAAKLLRLQEVLEDLDDTQNVYTNAQISADIMAQMA